MSNWNFEDMGDFADDAAAERWAKRNDIDLRDIRTTSSGNLACDRGHCRPFRTVIGAVLINHPHRTLADLR